MIDLVPDQLEGCIIFLNRPTEDGRRIVFSSFLTGWTRLESGNRMLMARDDYAPRSTVQMISECYIDWIDDYYQTIYSK